MIGNHWFAPGLLRGAWSRGKGGDRRGDLLLLRRGGILVIMLLAWAYSRFNSGNDALADIGAVSFSALGTLAPALGFAVWRPQTPPRAAIVGIMAVLLVLVVQATTRLMFEVHGQVDRIDRVVSDLPEERAAAPARRAPSAE